MTRRRSRRTAAAVALAAVVALATPAHAASRHASTAGPGWIEEAVQWIARLWTGNGLERELKSGVVSVPDPGTGTNGAVAPPGVEPASERGMGVDPDG
jgi:hypothetical protein